MTEAPEIIHRQLRGAPWRLLNRLATYKGPPSVMEFVIHGGGGCGKTYGLSQILYWLGNRYPGIRILVLRDVRADLATTFQKVWEEDVVPRGHKMLEKQRDRVGRKGYNFWNGDTSHGEHPTKWATTIELGGMDNVMRHRGTDYDVIYFLELVELNDEGEWSEFRRALRNFGGEAAKQHIARGEPRKCIQFQLLMADTNPDAPDHWILGRHERGELEMHQSVHKDNPKLWEIPDPSQPFVGRWSPFGTAYMQSLDGLFGVRKDRLRYHRWVAAEGVVYQNWNKKKYVIPPQPADTLGIRWYYAAMDWGHTDACCILVGGVTGDGVIYIVAEWYLAEQGIDYWTDVGVSIYKEFSTMGMVVDPSRPEMIERFNDRLGFPKDRPYARGADNKRASSGEGDMGGIDLVRQTIGQNKLFFLNNCLRHAPQPLLVAKHRATSTIKEFPSYAYRHASTDGEQLRGRQVELTDPRCDDHGMDCLRYLITAIYGKDLSLTPKSPKPKMSPEDEMIARAMGRL